MHEATHGDDFADWYGALWPKVLRAVTVSVGDPDLAEEATAEAFVKALVRWPRPLQFDSPLAWLHTIAVNEDRSRWRRAKLERRMTDRLSTDLRLVLDIARSLEPVPADDTRLTDVWDDSMAESWNE